MGKVIIFVGLFVLLLSHNSCLEEQKDIEKDNFGIWGNDLKSIYYEFDSTITNFIIDSLFDERLKLPGIDYCLIEHCASKNITKAIFYFTQKESKGLQVWKYSNRILKLKDFRLPLMFYTDWLFVEDGRDYAQEMNEHLLHPFNFNYAVLKFRIDQVLEFKPYYRRLERNN